MNVDERNELLHLVLSRLSHELPYDMFQMSMRKQYVLLNIGYDEYCRGCHMGRYSVEVIVTFDELTDPELRFEDMIKERWRKGIDQKKIDKNTIRPYD